MKEHMLVLLMSYRLFNAASVRFCRMAPASTCRVSHKSSSEGFVSAETATSRSRACPVFRRQSRAVADELNPNRLLMVLMVHICPPLICPPLICPCSASRLH